MLKFLNRLRYSRTRKTPEKEEMPPLISADGVVDSRMCGLVDSVQSGWFLQDSGELLKGFPITPADVVLDVGCGEGGATRFAARCGAHVIFSDTNADQVARLSEKIADSAARGFQALVGDSNPLQLADSVASKVIAMEMLEHVDDPAQVLTELVRVGQPGALYLLTVPDPISEGLQKKLAPAIHFLKPNHIHVFERNAFATMVTDAGLLIERQHAYSFYWSMWMCLYWACETQQEGATLDKIKAPYPPLLNEWANTWHQLISVPDGAKVKAVLDSFLPKSQIIIARKPN